MEIVRRRMFFLNIARSTQPLTHTLTRSVNSIKWSKQHICVHLYILLLGFEAKKKSCDLFLLRRTNEFSFIPHSFMIFFFFTQMDRMIAHFHKMYKYRNIRLLNLCICFFLSCICSFILSCFINGSIQLYVFLRIRRESKMFLNME